MTKEDHFDFNTNWYAIWMKQSKDFFETANQNFKEMFNKPGTVHPEEHMDAIRQWQEMLKKQWQFVQLNDQQKAFEAYWKNMAKMCNDACDMLVQEWIKRSHEQDPIKNVRELYELWLKCCNEIFTQAMHSTSYQETYGEFMNAALKFWKTSTPPKE